MNDRTTEPHLPRRLPWWRRLADLLRPGGRGRGLPPPPDDPHGLGSHGEELAVRTLLDSGLDILARNRRIAGVEIDVIARCPRERVLLLVEVKTVRGGRLPEARVDRTRRRRLVRAASRLAGTGAVAIEVMAINVEPSGTSIRRIRLDPADLDERGAGGGARVFSGC